MRLIWHIIWKDIVRDRWALGLWALLFVGQVVIGVIARNPGEIDLNRMIHLQTGSIGLVALQVIMGYVLVARLIQADALIGTTVFWMTRPISPVRLLLAKGLGVLLVFGLVPVVLLLPWWLYCGFGWREVFWTGVDTLGWQLLVIAPAFLVATLTDDLGRLLLWTLLLVLGLVSWMILMQSFGPTQLRGGFRGDGAGPMYTRLWLSALLLVLGAGVIAAHHYVTRHFVRSIVLVVCWLGLIVGVGRSGQRNWSPIIAAWSEPKVEPAPGLGDRVAVKLESASGRIIPPARKGQVSTEKAGLLVLLRASGVPGDLRLGLESAQQTWTWAGGVKFDRDSGNLEVGFTRSAIMRRRYSLPTPVPDEETKRWHQRQQEQLNERLERRGQSILRSPALPENKEGLLGLQNTVPNSLFAKMQAEPPAYRTDLRCVLYRPEVIAELPVLHESRARGGGETFHFRLVGKDDEALIHTHPTLTMSGLWFSAGISDRSPGSRWRRRSIMQINRVTGDIEEGRNFYRGATQVMIAGVAVYWHIFDLKSPKTIQDGHQMAKYPDWRKDTFLAVVVDREVGRFDQTVTAEKFELVSESGPP